MKNLIKVIICICILISSANAQPYFDVASVQSLSANHTLSNDSKKIPLGLNWYAFNLNFPVEINHRNLIVAGIGYEQFQFKFKEDDSPMSELSQTFNSAYLPLTLLHTWRDTSWNTSFTFIPKACSSKPLQLNDKTFQAGAAIIASHTVNNHFKYSFGAYYNSEFFGDYFLPLVGIEWKASPRLHVFGLLPNDFTVDYKVCKFLHTGFGYKGLTTSFRYKPASTADYLAVMSEGQLKLFADVYLTKSIVLNLEGGTIVARAYQLQNKNVTDPNKFDVRESSLFKIGLYYRVWM